ncbi:MAG TPA: 2-hydroxycarboxylate transporter family protein [Candidatus Ventrisoma faecale]|nr:2-hydroxycarboxylate transporter family protein [Candidatus Ventrisoma faecale]
MSGNADREKGGFEVVGIRLPFYLFLVGLLIVSMYTDCLPSGLVEAFLFLMVLGEGLNAVGNHVPVVRTYLGGSVICILGSAVIQAAGLIPDQTYHMVDQFINEEGFLVFYIAALITGSLFNIDRNLLLRATVRLLPVAVVSLALGVLLSGVVGIIMGDGFMEGILFIGVPMTSGGMTAGTVPLSVIYGDVLGGDAGEMLTRMAPATVMGNCVAIVFGGLINNLGQRRKDLTGNGQLVNDGNPVEKQAAVVPTIKGLCIGLLVALGFYQLGALLNNWISVIPTYAWMIILVILVKCTRLFPEELEDGARQWGQFAIHSWTSAALAGIGITLIDLNTIMASMTLFYLISIVAIVTVITSSAFFLGKLVGFYPIESAIAAGMCTTNMGGSGNVAVLSSAGRMELLPFAQIVTRSCGALMLTLGGILIQLLR